MNAGYAATKGIGIGLMTVKTLTKALQGAIHLNTREGFGTEVDFSVLTMESDSTCHINSKNLKSRLT